VKISVLEVPEFVRPISPIAKIAVNSAMKPMSLASLWMVASIAIAAVGSRQATIVVTKEVNVRIRLIW
jgi:hypothetical protein